MTSQQQASRLSSQRSWPVPAALVALSAIPLMAGTARLVQLGGGPQLIPADGRFAGRVLTVAGLMVACLVLGFTAIRRPHTAVALAGAPS